MKVNENKCLECEMFKDCYIAYCHGAKISPEMLRCHVPKSKADMEKDIHLLKEILVVFGEKEAGLSNMEVKENDN